ncbi:MAG: alanine--tRNA ligase [archaeon]|jgi:alanyl-tRNA synthetase|nr:alanine--tRNA ligase [archaeon]
MWTGKKLAETYLQFFKEKGHSIIPSASLIPENDPTVLFTTAGMHPLVPYLMGQPHPAGKRLVNNQKCIRTVDIDNIGDPSHLTFFFMLGNWSLGDYFKKEAIEWSYEFLTSKKWLGLDKEKISVTCFEGDKDAPKDEESAKVWESLGIPKERIYFNPKEDNWWGPAGKTGPCGPDTEIFFDTGKEKCGPKCVPGCGCGKYFEIWNDVFMQYNKTEKEKFEPLKQKNVDTGMGLERTVAMLQGKQTVYDTELFEPIMNKISELEKNDLLKSRRVVADHLRSACFILAEGKQITPSNVEQGYVLRRLITRSIIHGKRLGLEGAFCRKIAEVVVEIYGKDWPEIKNNHEHLYLELDREEERLSKLTSKEEGESGKLNKLYLKLYKLPRDKRIISGKDAFNLSATHGYPIEMLEDWATTRNLKVDKKAWTIEFEKHQALSRKSTEGKFKSGLQDNSEQTIKMHTATHLLHAALRKVLGEHVQQKGSNITPERLRFDFSNPEKVTPEQLQEVEKIVNENIAAGIAVKRDEMTLEDAKKKGALAFFSGKYTPEKVSVYSIKGVSKEVCTGPHVKNTKEIGKFKIKKEESISAGVRRIKAVVE